MGHLFSKMRTRNFMSTVLEYAQLFGPMMKESIKLTKCGFHYFTILLILWAPWRCSLHFINIPMTPQPTKNMSIAEQKVLRDWHEKYRQPVVQVTVKNPTTKDNIGTLPLYSIRPQPTPQPLSFSIWHDISAPRQHNLNSNADVLCSSQTVSAMKSSIAGITDLWFWHVYILGVAAEDIYQDQDVENFSKHLHLSCLQTKYFSCRNSASGWHTQRGC